MTTIKVAMVIRGDALTVKGGDSIQFAATARYLRSLGCSVTEFIGPQQFQSYKGYDLVHIFNLQTIKFSLGEARKVASLGVPLVLSTIYWDFESNEQAIIDSLQSTPKGRLAVTILGFKLAKSLKRLSLRFRFKGPRRRLLNMASILLPNSWQEVCQLEKVFELSLRERSFVVKNAIDSKLFAVSASPPQSIVIRGFHSGNYILQVGRVESAKRQVESIKAAKKLGIPIVIVGKIQEQWYFDLCREEATGHQVLIVDECSQDELVGYYSHCKVHILPSLRETPGLASLEAAACGANIVTTEIGSAKEYFGDQAYYCNPYDSASIEAALRAAWGHEWPNEDLRGLVLKEYTWEKTADETLAAYRIVKGKPSI